MASASGLGLEGREFESWPVCTLNSHGVSGNWEQPDKMLVTR